MTIHMRRAARVLRLVLPAMLAAAAFSAGPTAAAQTPGSIEGQVVNGADEASMADVEVSLQLFSVEADLGTLTETTDAKGRFAFTELPDGVAGYQLAAAFQGAVFRSVATGFTSGQTVEQTLTVWEPTTDPADVVLSDYIVWVDREGEGVAVQHDFKWTNGGDTAYVGAEGADGVVTVPLPQGAASLQYLGTFLENPGEVVGQTFVSQAPIVPGQSTATVRYNAPPLSSLTLELPFATTSVQLFVPQDVTLTATALRMAGTVTDQGVTYQVYAAQDIASGTTIEVTMSQGEGGTSAANPAMWILLGVAGLVILGGLIAFAVRRARTGGARLAAPRSAARPLRAKARPAEARADGARERVPAGAPAQGNGHIAEPAEDPDLIIEEIAALDLSFERGLLEERAYKRLRVAAKDRLLRAEGARAKGGKTR
jgi:hypothetical protein